MRSKHEEARFLLEKLGREVGIIPDWVRGNDEPVQ